MRKVKKILIIIQRSNGDVFLSISLINNLYKYYKSPEIDLLVNDDTYPIAKLLPNISKIHQFSYLKKQDNRLQQEKNLVISLFRKYDLSVNLTASDRSVMYSLIAGRKSISAIEKDNRKSWWKKLFLNHYYFFDSNNHILLNNLKPLSLLNIEHENDLSPIRLSSDDCFNVQNSLKLEGIDKFIIFHPSAQYNYKVYPKILRDGLLQQLNTLGVSIIVTGGNSEIDLKIKNEIPLLLNVFNFIGKTTLKEYLVLSELSLAYIGMDTLNMHIAASQNKPIFAIFGPTKLSTWSPWSNLLKKSVSVNKPIQTYGKNTIFQANMNCVACNKKGCDNSGKSDCLTKIKPHLIFEEVNNWFQNV